MTFTEYVEEKTNVYRKNWLNQVIQDYRIRIQSHLDGKRDKKLEKELEKKKDTIMNTEDTLERFMNGILKVDMIAQAIFEPNTRNVPKDVMVVEYLKNYEIKLDVEKLEYNGFELKLAIWSGKSNDAGVYSKFRKLKNTKYNKPTILITDGPKIKQEYLEDLKEIHNLKVMNIEQFIKWTKLN